MQSNKEAVSAAARPVDPHQWVVKYADYLYTYAIMRLNDEEQAKDMVQETFLAALERVDKFEGKSSESTWLTANIKNKVIDVYRKRSSEAARHGRQDAGYAQFFDPENGHWNPAHQPRPIGFEDQLVSKEFTQILQACMRKLPALWLSVFSMKHMDDEATAVICRELGISAANFWVIIHRAKLHVRACLQKNWI